MFFCKWCLLGECWDHNLAGLAALAALTDLSDYDNNPGKRKAWTDAETPASKRKRGSAAEAKPNNSQSSWKASQPSWKSKKPKANQPDFQRAFLDPDNLPGDLGDMQGARARLAVSVDGGSEGVAGRYAPITTFEELTLLPVYVFQALEKMQITAPMPIQAQALPIVLGGHDLVGVAKTGSGKTLAYLLPAIVHVEAQPPIDSSAASPIALALAPTRELAIQISEEAKKILRFSRDGGSNHEGGLWASCVYGGLDKGEQLRSSMGCHILAATPGRLMDLVTNGKISMDRVTYFVLDEGDRMLDDGFEDQLKSIACEIRSDRHMLFFSATWPKKVQDLAMYMCHGSQRPVRLRVGQSGDGAATSREDIVQEVVVFDQATWDERDKKKQQLLYKHVRAALQSKDSKVLVFVSRKDLAEAMSQQFIWEGFPAETLHGGRSQNVRLQVLEQFKSWNVRLLVTTDVMGRGLDIPSISHVVVYDMGDVDDYVHRIGRTARGPYGKGHALTLFEYDPKWPHLAEGLIGCLEKAGQEVPDDLRRVAYEVSMGSREVKSMKAGSKWGKLSGWQGSASEAARRKLGYSKYEDGDAAWKTW